MEHDGEDESGEMFSPNEVGEYTLCEDTVRFTVQGLRDVLTTMESTVIEWPLPMEEFVMQLEATMADWHG